jgi:hypothetical protein
VSEFLITLRASHVPGVSWRPQPARVATRGPGQTSDGRSGLKHTGPLAPSQNICHTAT